MISRPVSSELELADDVRSKQAHDVGANREGKAWEDLLGNRGATDQVPALEDQYLASRSSQVGSADQTVVAATDDDVVVARVLGLHARFLAGLKNGVSAIVARTRCRSYSTVISTSTSLPIPALSVSIVAMPISFLRVGDHVPLVT